VGWVVWLTGVGVVEAGRVGAACWVVAGRCEAEAVDRGCAEAPADRCCWAAAWAELVRCGRLCEAACAAPEASRVACEGESGAFIASGRLGAGLLL